MEGFGGVWRGVPRTGSCVCVCLRARVHACTCPRAWEVRVRACTYAGARAFLSARARQGRGGGTWKCCALSLSHLSPSLPRPRARALSRVGFSPPRGHGLAVEGRRRRAESRLLCVFVCARLARSEHIMLRHCVLCIVLCHVVLYSQTTFNCTLFAENVIIMILYCIHRSLCCIQGTAGRGPGPSRRRRRARRRRPGGGGAGRR